MTQTMCATGCGRPTTAVLCRPCVDQLQDALTALASWSDPPPAVHLGTMDDPLTPMPVGVPGRGTSSIWDAPSLMLGKTQGLAAELDVVRARQQARSDGNGPRPAPGSKVWAPNSRIDRAERELTRAVQHWIAVLASGDVVAPHAVVTGHVLARSCTWLLWHVQQIAVHPQAVDAHRAFVKSARDIERLVDRPEDRVYVGPCWATTAQNGGMQPECVSDLYAKPGARQVQCRVCGHVVGVDERRAWLIEHLEEMELPAADCSRAVATIGLTVSRSLISMWATRGRLVSSSKRGSKPLYRVGDVMGLAVSDPDGKKATA